ncbi:MAG: hypothetical protein ACI8Q6_001304 [Granulosicoccus sp.]
MSMARHVTLYVLSLLLVISLATQARPACRQALVLGLDVSGSVDSHEYRLQLAGLAAALRHPDVMQALLAMPTNPVHLAVFEWSAPSYQRLLLNWTVVTDETTLRQIITRLANTTRETAPPGTALGTAMQRGATLLTEQKDCWKHTLDISGDGKHNQGPHPRDILQTLDARTLTINALVIGADTTRTGDRRLIDIAELVSYFNAWVILGSDAFVETALGFEDYEAAMVRKLKRELEGPVLSSLQSSP